MHKALATTVLGTLLAGVVLTMHFTTTVSGAEKKGVKRPPDRSASLQTVSSSKPASRTVGELRSQLKREMGTDKIVFIRRRTLNSNHYYTEHINSEFKPGGGVCILDLNDGSVREIKMPKPGVVNRFDISYDARKIVFDFKDDHMEGYRIYEAVIKTGKIRQLTFPPKDEDALQKRYKVRTLWDSNWDKYHHGESNDYHHGTDDMHPCYLPDGGIAFVSTRCQISTICDGPDIFTTTNMYRMDADGKSMRRLSRDMVSLF